MLYDKIDIGNVRGIQGEKGDKGDRGSTPTYEDIKYKKKNEQFVTIVTDSAIRQSDYYLDAEGRLCNSEGYLYDENMQITTEKGVPFDIEEYGYEYERLYLDEQNRFCNVKGELLDENYKVQYVPSGFINDIITGIYDDEEAYNTIINDLFPHITNSIVTADPNDPFYKSFFDTIEGDIKYYICADNPKTSIYYNTNNNLVNTCKYKDENGVLVNDGQGGYAIVPLEKNALYYRNILKEYISNEHIEEGEEYDQLNISFFII